TTAAIKDVLKVKLYDYLVHNNQDLLLSLQQRLNVDAYLEEQLSAIQPELDKCMTEELPAYLIEERCMDILTRELRPSKFNYIRSILEEEFPQDFQRMVESGVLTYEVVNLIEACSGIFEER